MTYSKDENRKNKAIRADIYGEAMFFLIPVLGLFCVSIAKNSASIKDIFYYLLTTSDWSLMSTVIFGQCAHKMAKIVPMMQRNINSSQYSFYVAKRIFLIVVSMLTYSIIIFFPNIYLGIIQIIIFLLAIFIFLQDSFATHKLLDKNNTN
ncbi:hypothetical protein ISO79_03200 [Morganella morganii subsp. morganii]|uniref:Uncharacterized protein n=1 Tax=Morganella morganii TaxID=582 RepID=A0AAE4FEY5_MORMO|nr:hypothetical protein [Morganella morganii]MBT0372742.1 hypothetical protein [Morganella morganii subsp. morganii]MBT0392447.1 hypothetical protein [Morganella morganii subsp. morganii]MCT1586459.1 hypothetical protein [Morganella morganii]MDS0898855.1 hypothetical protein [Morganella morganii]